jgi:peptidyl-prolyl cis-trans isomerase SurA
MCEKRKMSPRFLALLLATLFAATSAKATPVVLDRLEASVNSSLVMLSDVRLFRRTLPLRSQLDPLFAGTALASKGVGAPDADIVEFLINDQLILQAFPVTDAEVEQEVNSIQSNNRIDRQTLRNALREQGFNFDDYFDLIRVSASKRNLIDRDIRTKVSISDDDVRNHFYNRYGKDSKDSSGVGRSYRLQTVSIPIRDYKTPAAARAAAQNAQDNLKKGADVEEVSLSDGELNATIKEQVKKLNAGEVSSVFGGPSLGAFFVIKLLEVKSGDSEQFLRAKEEIRAQLAAGEYQHQISLWLDRQRQKAFIHKAGDPAVSSANPAAP